jgi:hypothetical protein
MNKVSIYYFCVICVLLASCNRKTAKLIENPTNPPIVTTPIPTNTTPKTTDDDKNAYVMFSIERTMCYGNCPVYEAKIMSNGKAYFKGSRGIEMVGNYESKVTAEQIKDIWHNVAQVDFFKFADRYPTDINNAIPDLPNTYTFVNDGKMSKKITDNYDSPANLQWFEHELETVFLQLNWTKIDNK